MVVEWFDSNTFVTLFWVIYITIFLTLISLLIQYVVLRPDFKRTEHKIYLKNAAYVKRVKAGETSNSVAIANVNKNSFRPLQKNLVKNNATDIPHWAFRSANNSENESDNESLVEKLFASNSSFVLHVTNETIPDFRLVHKGSRLTKTFRRGKNRLHGGETRFLEHINDLKVSELKPEAPQIGARKVGTTKTVKKIMPEMQEGRVCNSMLHNRAHNRLNSSTSKMNTKHKTKATAAAAAERKLALPMRLKNYSRPKIYYYNTFTHTFDTIEQSTSKANLGYEYENQASNIITHHAVSVSRRGKSSLQRAAPKIKPEKIISKSNDCKSSDYVHKLCSLNNNEVKSGITETMPSLGQATIPVICKPIPLVVECQTKPCTLHPRATRSKSRGHEVKCHGGVHSVAFPKSVQ